MNYRIAATCLSLALLGNAGLAQAQIAHASASVSNLHFTTLDLTPNDGVTGGAIFNGNAQRSIYGYLWQDETCSSCGDITHPSANETAELRFDSVYAHTLTRQGPMFGATTRSEASATGDMTISGPIAYTRSTNVETFTLLAHTSITVSGHATVYTDGNGSLGSGKTASDYAYIFMGMRLSQADQFSAAWGLDNSNDQYPYVKNVDLAQDFAITYTNNSNVNQRVDLHAESSSRVDVSPIPEPSSFAMLGGGLLLLAARRRRA
ncbi:hypothetical protein RugamoR64_53770 [Duganella rhizosphaerae]|uniref:PEP-CTERM sorting domain-containing protein n=1 Tax=Duganella rhizosphaerae TaxID=2885763 RepID=UPI0030EAC310